MRCRIMVSFPRNIDTLAEAVVLVTAKDAVKLAHPVDPRVWVVEIDVDLPPSLLNHLTGLLPRRRQRTSLMPFNIVIPALWFDAITR